MREVAPVPSGGRIDRPRASFRVPPTGNGKAFVWEFEPNSSEKQQLVIDPLDEARFADFLSQPDTGLVRLLPFHARGRVVSVEDPEISRRPGFSLFAATYSFTKRKHGRALSGWHDPPLLGWAELMLKDGILLGAVMEDSVAFMVKLGDVPIENISLQTNGIAELDSFQPPDNRTDANRMYEISLRGVRIGDFLYSSKIPATVNTTYVLRSAMSRRADVLVCFRIVRRDNDDSLTIIWKKLKQYRKPSWYKA